MPRSKFIQAAQLFLICCAGSIAVGLAVYGTKIFVPNSMFFQFVGSGVFCSLFVASAMFLRKLHTVVVVVVSLVLLRVFIGSNSVIEQDESYLHFRNAVYMVGLVVVASVGVASSRWYPKLKFGKFIVWSAASAAVHLAALFLLALIRYQTVSVNPDLVQATAEVAALVGAGIGFGFEMWELFRQRVSGTEENSELGATQVN